MGNPLSDMASGAETNEVPVYALERGEQVQAWLVRELGVLWIKYPSGGLYGISPDGSLDNSTTKPRNAALLMRDALEIVEQLRANCRGSSSTIEAWAGLLKIALEVKVSGLDAHATVEARAGRGAVARAAV
jgi:hypothetical protein